jgi:hypothetical protein
MATGDLISLQEARDFCGLSDVEHTEMNTELAALVTSASRLIGVYTGREFAAIAGSATRVFTFYGGSKLLLNERSLRTVTSVEIDTDTDTPTTLVANTDYYLLPRGGDRDGVYTSMQLVSCEPSTKDWREIEITGTWGYSSVPEDIKTACKFIVKHMYQNISPNAGGFDDSSDRFGISAMPTISRQLLAPYKWVGFGGR